MNTKSLEFKEIPDENLPVPIGSLISKSSNGISHSRFEIELWRPMPPSDAVESWLSKCRNTAVPAEPEDPEVAEPVIKS